MATKYMLVIADDPSLYTDYENRQLPYLPILCPIRVQMMHDLGNTNGRELQIYANEGVWYQSEHGLEPVFELRKLVNTSGIDRVMAANLGIFEIRVTGDRK